MEKSFQYKSLMKTFKKFDNEKLENIINSDEYTDLAKQVAADILSSDQTEYYANMEHSEEVKALQQKEQETLDHPLYKTVNQMAEDLRFLKNVVIAMIVLYILGILIVLLNF